MTLWTPGGRYEDVLVPAARRPPGRQRRGARWRRSRPSSATRSTLEVVEEGFAAVRVPGRLEVLGRRPLLLVDGAHNAAGMAALGDALTEEFAVDGTSVAVVGHAVGSRPVGDAGAAGRGRGRRRSSRANRTRRAPCRVGRGGRGRPRPRAGRRTRSPTSRDALRVARGMVDADGLVVVAGSLYVVGAARADVLAAAVPWEEAGR